MRSSVRPLLRRRNRGAAVELERRGKRFPLPLHLRRHRAELQHLQLLLPHRDHDIGLPPLHPWRLRTCMQCMDVCSVQTNEIVVAAAVETSSRGCRIAGKEIKETHGGNKQFLPFLGLGDVEDALFCAYASTRGRNTPVPAPWRITGGCLFIEAAISYPGTRGAVPFQQEAGGA
jgi:hypothetical protein